MWDNYNFQYDYPVYVHYFDDIYDSKDLQNSLTLDTSQNVNFIQVPYSTPKFLKENELYYNRSNLWYVKRSFSIKRKGYLHMCNFTSNMYGYQNTQLENYDVVITHDDESGYEKVLPYDPVKDILSLDCDFGAYSYNTRLKNGEPHQGHLDTRINLFNHLVNFIKKYRIIPKSKNLRNVLKMNNPENNFHKLEWADTYVIKTKMFKTASWKIWIKSVNESGGIYKYRWGDNEIYSLYAHLFLGNVHNFKTVEEGYHNQGKYRHLSNIAPSVKDTTR